MMKILALLATLSILIAVPSLALAAGLSSVASLSVGERERADGLSVSPSGDFYVAVSSPKTTRLVTRTELGGRVVTDRIEVPSTGLVQRITPSGETSTFATLPAGPLNGTVLDGNGTGLYVALASRETPTHGIWRSAGRNATPELWVALPTNVEPTGLTFRGGDLLVSDSANGRIYLISALKAVSIWSDDALLRGASGIAFTTAKQTIPVVISSGLPVQEYLYVAAGSGRIVRIPVRNDGTAGTAETFFQSSDVDGARGITFDGGADGGTLVVAVGSHNRLVAISPFPDPQARTLLEGGALQSPVGVVRSSAGLFVLNAGATGSASSSAHAAVQRVTDVSLPL